MDRLDYLIEYLLKEQNRYKNVKIPTEIKEKRNLFRALCNIRMPKTINDNDFIRLQDQELQEQLKEKGIVDLKDIDIVFSKDERILLWQGDITRLRVDAIVNAANSQMLGCFAPLHACIDNAIHSAAGIQLREECYYLMQQQGHDEPTGRAKITKGYNLPSKYVIHTVGPIIYTEKPSLEEENMLKDCYTSCLELTLEKNLKSIAVCCISTGEFHFPNDKAAEIAFKTVRDFLERTHSELKVIFNVFKDKDLNIYKKLLEE
ncbi:MAG: protein-ADP-ribose hydrolase [Synergistales bacterium]|nr:protein-ADP-ribose hydrolase [Synergistales bacterium]